jgi:hypothetical protein
MKQTMKLFLLLWATILCPFTTLNAQDVWDGSIAESFAGGTGKADDPYLIETGAELAYLAQITKENGSQTSGKYYKLTADIVLNDDVLDDNLKLKTGNIASFKEWIPIGYGNNSNSASDPYSFMGCFDGAGHVISGVYVVNHGNRYAGLFGVCDGGEIHNLAVVDSYIDATDAFGGAVIAGHLLGYSGYSNGMKVYQCYAEGYVMGGTNAGIIVGHNGGENALISESYCYGRILSAASIGSVAGYCDRASIRNCYSVALTGVNGTASVFRGDVTNIYYDSTVNSQGNYATGKTTEEMKSEEFAQLLGAPFVYAEGKYPYIDGLPVLGERTSVVSGLRLRVGELTNGHGSTVKFYREYDGTDVSKSAIRAEAGETVYVKVIPYKRMLITGGAPVVTNDATGAAVKLTALPDSIWSFIMPESNVTVTAKFYKDPKAPIAWDGSVAESFAGGTGTQDDPYLIETGAELAYLAKITKENASQTSGKYYKLTDNIILNEDVLTEDFHLNGTPENEWMPIGDPDNSTGHYNTGKGFKGYFDGAGNIVSGLYCVYNGRIIGLFGSVEGEVHDLSVIDSYVSGGRFAGAVAGGNNHGKIYRCYAEAYVCNADYYGVAVGHTEGRVEYCYASGRVEGGNRGGILGWVNSGSYGNCFSAVIGGGACENNAGSKCYYDSNVNTSGGSGTPLTTAEMQSEDFAATLGEPFVYVEGNYPYIEGLPMIGEDVDLSTAGFRLNRDAFVNGKGSSIKFYRDFDGTDVARSVSRIDAGETVYMKLFFNSKMLLTEGSLVLTNDATAQPITLKAETDKIFSFTMPESSVTVTASFHRNPTLPAIWDGTVANTFAGGTGTKDDPYLISNGAELAYLSNLIEIKGSNYIKTYFKLIDDIVLNDEVLTKDLQLNEEKKNQFNKWQPIGYAGGTSSDNRAFNGHFDGDNHFISGVYCPDYPESGGLFGVINNGEVHDLSVLDSYITGGTYVGGLSGHLSAYQEGESAKAYRCYVEACVVGGSYVGLLVGHDGGGYANLYDCYSYGRVSGSCTGGITGYIDRGYANHCFSVCLSGNSGIYSASNSQATNLYFDNTVNTSGSNSTGKSTVEMQSEAFADMLGEPFEFFEGNYPYIAGLYKIGEDYTVKQVGYRINTGLMSNSNGSTIKTYATFNGEDVAKVLRRAEAGETVYLKPILTRNMQIAENSLLVTNDETGEAIALNKVAKSIWSFIMPEASITMTARFYPNPKAAIVWDGTIATDFSGGTGTQDDPYLISNGEELAYLAQLTSNNPDDTKNKYYRLTDNIMLNDEVLDENFQLIGTPKNMWTPIGSPRGKYFYGDFDGAGHVISGVYSIGESAPTGLFGESAGCIHDLAVIDSYVKGYETAIISGAGRRSDSISISRCYAEGNVYGYYAGLIVGGDNGKSTVEYCYGSGTVASNHAAGGLVGDMYANMNHCYSIAKISAGYGLVSITHSNTFEHLYYDNTLSPISAGVSKPTCLGKSTTEMQSQAFAELLGEPFVYAAGNYPYIKGLPKIGEVIDFSSKGYHVNVGKLTYAKGSTLKFYSSFDGTDVSQAIRSANPGETVYLQVKLRRSILLSESDLKLINDSTGHAITLTNVAENIWSFTMPDFSVTASADFHRNPDLPIVWEGDIAETFVEGEGTEEDPYIINYGEELAYLAQLTNANADLTKNKYFELGADIYLNDIMLNDEFELEGTPDNEWTPIGNSSNAFRGHFDGKDHIISGLYTNGGDYRGLFGVVEGATIQNLNIIDSYVKGNVIGALAGSMGRNDSCFVSRCYIEATLDPTGSSAGLITGLTCYLNMKNCYTNGQVKNSYSYRGSLVGQIYNSPTITNCFTVVKGAQPLGNMNANGNTNNVYFDSDFFGSTYTNRDNFRSATNIEMFTTDFAERMGEPYEYVLGNYPYIPGLMKVGENRGWESPTDPTHGGAGDVWDGERSIIFASGTGTETDPYIINNGAQLAYLAKLTNANANLTKNRYFELGADIVLNENVLDNDFELKGTPANVWEPIGYSTSNVFRGHFDGKGHNISGIYTNGGDYRGLFGIVEGSTICNLNIIDSYVAGSTIGALAGSLGRNDSCFVSRCYVEATLYPTSSNSGLIAGMTCYLNMEECYVNGQVKNSYSYRGGLLGYMVNSPTVTNCYAVVKNVQAAGNVNNGGNFYNVYYDSDIAGSTHKTSEYFRGATTVEMLSTDFATRMGEPYEYALGYYPFIYGMHKINKDGKTVIVKGYSLQLGTLTNGKNCNISFYRTYVKKTNTLDNQVIAGSKVMLEGPTAIYAKLDIDATKRLSDDGLIVKTITGESIEVSKVDDDLYMFTMPENTITVSAKFVTGGFCGNPEVNNGRDMMWQLSDDQNTLTISGTGEMYSNAWTAYANTVKAIEVTEGITLIKDQAFKGLNKATTLTLPATLTTIGTEAFAQCTATIEMSACTKIDAIHANEFAQYAGSTVYLPITVSTIEADAFSGTYANVQHVYSPIETGTTLYANGNQVPDVNGMGDIAKFGITNNQAVNLIRYTGFTVTRGEIAGTGSTLRFYADEAMTTEIPNGYKAIREDDATKVYVKALPGTTSILFVNGLTVKAGSSTLAVTQESDDVFSFLMPAADVTISAKYSTGGYCGENGVNNGHNLIWTLNNGTLAFQKNALAVGNSLNMGSWASGKAPWNTLGGSIKSVDLSGVKNIGNNAFSGCTNLVGLELPASPVITVGENAFAEQMVLIIPAESWNSYQEAGWEAYAEQTTKDKENFSMKDGQQWRTYYSKVGRLLPSGLKAYTITGIGSAEVSVSKEMDYIPAGQAVLIENAGKEARTAEVVTSLQPYSQLSPVTSQLSTPVCLLTTEEDNLLQWITVPTAVTAGQGYTLYKDEFVKVSSGTLPAGVAFLPAQGIIASRLFIDNGEDVETGIDIVEDTTDNDQWYTLDGKKLSGKPSAKGIYIRNGQKVMMK